MPDKGKGRPPVTSQGSGPKTQNVTITKARIARPAVLHVSDLPVRIAGNVTVDGTSGCWVVGAGGGIYLDKDGYARLGGQGVHRIVYRLLVGEIPADRPVLDHVKAWGCVSRACCRPAHLQACTVRDNTLRGRSFAAVNFAKEKCGACGTPYDLINTYWHGNRRDCRRCIARRAREYKRRVQAGQAVTRRTLGRAA